ncbi:MAG: zinc-ribbon domain-containing protein [Promethearchaeota archaeon]
MAQANVSRQFSLFGTKMLYLAVLSILSFIFGLLANFIFAMNIVNMILQILILIIFLLALGDIKEIGYTLNNRLLLEFRSKILYAFLLYIIGLILFNIGLIVLIILGIIILIVAAVFRIQAWSRCNDFFIQNTSIFPANIGSDAIDGSKYLKYAAILYLTIILSFIGAILEVVGYFKLSSLKNLQQIGTQQYVATPAPVVAPSTPTTSQPSAETAETAKFCPHCGSPITPGQKFCSTCGSEL